MHKAAWFRDETLTFYEVIGRGSVEAGLSRQARSLPGRVREVRVRAFDERQTIPFELSGDRSTVGRVQVVRRWRLEPAPGGRPRGPLEGLQGL